MIGWIVVAALSLSGIQPSAGSRMPTESPWQLKVKQEMPLLGHRNWIVIADSAYPWQTSPGVETIETNADHFEVLQTVLRTLKGSIHVRPDVFMDEELAFVPEQDAPGADNVKKELETALAGFAVQKRPHEKIIGSLDEAGKTFHVLLLKTKMAVPYTSVFFQLNCKYWSDEAEKRMRSAMNAAH